MLLHARAVGGEACACCKLVPARASPRAMRSSADRRTRVLRRASSCPMCSSRSSRVSGTPHVSARSFARRKSRSASFVYLRGSGDGYFLVFKSPGPHVPRHHSVPSAEAARRRGRRGRRRRSSRFWTRGGAAARRGACMGVGAAAGGHPPTQRDGRSCQVATAHHGSACSLSGAPLVSRSSSRQYLT